MLTREGTQDPDQARIEQLAAVSSARNALKNAAEDSNAAVRDFLAQLATDPSIPELLSDPTQLRLANQQLRQAMQALAHAGLDKPALLLSAMAELLDRFVQKPASCDEDSSALLMRASSALMHFLDAVLQGQSPSVLPLFVPYQALCTLLGRAQMHPADLWPMSWRWVTATLPPIGAPLAYGSAVRGRMDLAVLDLVKSGNTQAAQNLSDLCQGLALAQTEPQPLVFWQIAGAFFEALAHGCFSLDVYAKRTTLRVLRQYTALERQDWTGAQPLAHELLFFCDQVESVNAEQLPVLSGVLRAYGLAHEPVTVTQKSSENVTRSNDLMADLEFPQLPTHAQAVPEPVSEIQEVPSSGNEDIVTGALPAAGPSELDSLIDDEQMRVIGPLRISIPEYNIYLNEADEWSRRLQTELSEWSLELHRPLATSTVALAQAIEISSAKVGFLALAGLAKVLAEALTRFAQGVQVEPAQARIFVAAAEAVRHLLHQFAAGFLKEPEAELITTLKRLVNTSALTQDAMDSEADPQPDLQPSLLGLDPTKTPSDPKDLDAHIEQVETSIAELSSRLEAMRLYLHQLQTQSEPAPQVLTTA